MTNTPDLSKLKINNTASDGRSPEIKGQGATGTDFDSLNLTSKDPAPTGGDNPNQDPAPDTPYPTSTQEPVKEKIYQQYNSTRQSQRLFTELGVPITFSGFEFITKNKDIIKYLNHQIAIRGIPGISIGEKLSTAKKNPMEELRNKHFAEFQKMKDDERANMARGIKQDMGSTKPLSEQQLGAVTSGQVASPT